MTAVEIIEEFKALPPAERVQVTKFVVENDDSWIPDAFKQGMADAEAGDLTKPIALDTEAHLIALDLNSEVELRRVSLEAIANDCIFGIMGATVLK